MTHPDIQALIDLGPELETTIKWCRAYQPWGRPLELQIAKIETILRAITALKTAPEAGYVMVPTTPEQNP